MSAFGLFVSGTDTGVGKTRVTAALARVAAAHGERVIAAKPVESGCVEGLAADAEALRAVSNVALGADESCLYRFATPVAPLLAAELAGQSIDVLRLFAAMRALESRADWLLVEGAGGICVPLTESVSFLEWAGLLGYPVLVVARSQLGTINHTLLTLRVLQQAELPVAAVVLNRTVESAGPDEPHNRRLIELQTDVPLFGPTSFCADVESLAEDPELQRCYAHLAGWRAQTPRTRR